MKVWDGLKGMLTGRKTMTAFGAVQIVLVVNLAMDVEPEVAARITWAVVGLAGLYMIANSIKGYFKGDKK